MNDGISSPSAFENFQKCVYRLARRCYNCMNCIQRRRVWPENLHYDHNKFIRLQSNKLIRVIHYKKSEIKCSFFDESGYLEGDTRSSSFSESDYTFTSWSKPLRLCDECRRSFKNLWQETTYNPVSKQCSGDLQEGLCPSSNLSSDEFCKKDVKVTSAIESFIDALVKDVIKDSLNVVCCTIGRDVVDTSNRPLESPCVKYKHSNKFTKLNNSEHSVNDDLRGDIITNKQCFQYCHEDIEIDSSTDPESKFQKKSSLVSKVLGARTDCNSFLKEAREHTSSLEEKYAYYNNSFSGVEEETNIDQEKVGDKAIISSKNTLGICTHLNKSDRRLVLVFLHGVGCGAEVWLHQLRYFARRDYDVAAPDMLGHGLSSAPDRQQDYCFRQLTRHALRVVEAVVPHSARCVLIGHAFGCSVAAAVARAVPTRVALLVLVSGGGPTPLAPRGPDARPPQPAPWRRLLPLRPLLCCGFSREVVYAAPRGKHIPTAQAANEAGAGALGAVPAYVLRHVAERAHMWPEGDAAFHRRISQPALLVHGLRDAFVSLPQECDMERTIPRASLELIPNAGHFAMLEAPGRLNHMIECFINWWNL